MENAGQGVEQVDVGGCKWESFPDEDVVIKQHGMRAESSVVFVWALPGWAGYCAQSLFNFHFS